MQTLAADVQGLRKGLDLTKTERDKQPDNFIIFVSFCDVTELSTPFVPWCILCQVFVFSSLHNFHSAFRILHFILFSLFYNLAFAGFISILYAVLLKKVF